MTRKSRGDKAKNSARKAQRRQEQFERSHSQEAFDCEREKRKRAWEKVMGEPRKACVYHSVPTPFGIGYMADLSHYEFTFDQLVEIGKGKNIDLAECHQEGDCGLPEYHKADLNAVRAAIDAFGQKPFEDTMILFLDADPRKTNRQILSEWERGIRTSGYLIECVNHAIAKPERAEKALHYALWMGCPMVEIDLPNEVLAGLR